MTHPTSEPEEDWYREFQRVNARGAARPSPAPPRGVPPQERRRHARFEVDEETGARLYRGRWMALLGFGKNRARRVIDLSEGGVRILATERLLPGTRVRIRIEMEKFGDAIEAAGTIRWCYQSARSPQDFFAGVMFIDLAPAQVRKIARLREWLRSPQYRALREARRRERDSGLILPR